MVDEGSVDIKEEQDVATSVDNICYEKIPSKLDKIKLFKP